MSLTMLTRKQQQQQQQGGETAPWSPVLRTAPEWFFALFDGQATASQEVPPLSHMTLFEISSHYGFQTG